MAMRFLYWVQDLKTTHIVATLAVGTVMTVSIGYAGYRKVENAFKSVDYIQETERILLEHGGARIYLGDNIKVTRYSHNRECLEDQTLHYMKAYVKGTDGKGTLYLTLYKNDDRWSIRNIELSLKSEANRHLIIK